MIIEDYPKCSNIDHHHDDKKAVIYCFKCEKFFCEECERVSHDKASGLHREYITENFDSIKKDVDRCPLHNFYRLDLFCPSHYALCCRECISNEDSVHKDCKVVPLDDKYNVEMVKRNIITDFTSLENKVERLMETTFQNIKMKQDEMEENVQTVKTKISNVFTEIRQAIDAREEGLLRSLEDIYEAESLEPLIKDLNECVNMLDELKIQIKCMNFNKENDDERCENVNIKRIVQHGCEIRSMASYVDDLNKKATLALNNVPKIKFENEVYVLPKMINFGNLYVVRGPHNIVGKSEWWSTITLYWDDESFSSYGVEMKNEDSTDENEDYHKVYEGEKKECKVEHLNPGTNYAFRVRRKATKENPTEWSNKIVVKTLECHWKECPETVSDDKKYDIYGISLRKAAFTGGNDGPDSWCTIIGDTSLPLGGVMSWSVKVVTSKQDDGNGIFIGIAPSCIDQNCSTNLFTCGWYFDCLSSTLCSGPPHNYWYKRYDPEKYIYMGEIIGIEIDMSNGNFSFVVNNVNIGVAYEGIPLDKPLVPCVLLKNKDDSVEIRSK